MQIDFILKMILKRFKCKQQKLYTEFNNGLNEKSGLNSICNDSNKYNINEHLK